MKLRMPTTMSWGSTMDIIEDSLAYAVLWKRLLERLGMMGTLQRISECEFQLTMTRLTKPLTIRYKELLRESLNVQSLQRVRWQNHTKATPYIQCTMKLYLKCPKKSTTRSRS